MDGLAEFRAFVPMLLDHIGLRSLVQSIEFWDVEDLSVVEDSRADLTEAKRLVAIITTVLEIGSVLQLLLSR